jgi:hypothetical protein
VVIWYYCKICNLSFCSDIVSPYTANSFKFVDINFRVLMKSTHIYTSVHTYIRLVHTYIWSVHIYMINIHIYIYMVSTHIYMVSTHIYGQYTHIYGQYTHIWSVHTYIWSVHTYIWSVHIYMEIHEFVEFLISWVDTIHKIHENWYPTKNNDFIVYISVMSAY